jgi:hypothetical protein
MVHCNESDHYFGHYLLLGQWYVKCVSRKRWVPWETVRIFSRTLLHSESKNKAIPVQPWRGPEGSRRLRLPDFKTIDT